MRSVFSEQVSVSIWRRYVLVTLIFAAFTVGCGSIPSLEKPECTEARDAVKRFYSFHFANDMSYSKENLEARNQFLTVEFFNSISQQTKIPRDPFTLAGDGPKAFRVGECKVQSAEKTIFQVLLLWKDDTRSEQKEIAVDMVKQGDKWLVDGVSPVKAK